MNIHEHILEGLGEGVIGLDSNLTVIAYNQLAEKITGVSRSQALERTIEEVLHQDQWLAITARKVLEDGKTMVEYERGLYQRRGGLIPVDVTTSPIHDPDGNILGVVILLRDLSGIKSLEEESLRTEGLAFIDTFTAGIAHEIKNPLGGIRGATQLLAKRIREKELLEYTGVIIKEVDRLNAILGQVLKLTGPQRLSPGPLNIHEVLDAVVLLQMEVALTRGIDLTKVYDPSIPLILGDRGQLTQVFLNLIKNGIEACEVGGRVMVVTRMVTDFYRVNPPYGSDIPAGYKRGRMVAIEFRDNGCGIPQEELARVFTPFFTKKEKGSGLGLSISFRIVKEHGGSLRIESIEGVGTTVSVFLPIAE